MTIIYNIFGISSLIYGTVRRKECWQRVSYGELNTITNVLNFSYATNFLVNGLILVYDFFFKLWYGSVVYSEVMVFFTTVFWNRIENIASDSNSEAYKGNGGRRYNILKAKYLQRI